MYYCKTTRTVLASAVVLSLALIAACGPGGPTRYEISGKATFGGKPIPAGRIVFESQEGAAVKGVTGMAMIENGLYRSLPDRGPTGGPQIVRVYGYDGDRSLPKIDFPQGRAIFQEYVTKTDLPEESSVVDFNVPLQR